MNNPRQTSKYLQLGFAWAFATHLLFGLASVLNTPGFEFFYYYPRQIRLVLIDSRVDVLVWVASVACSSILAIWSSRNTRKPAILVGVAALAIVVDLALLLPFLGGSTDVAVVYLLFLLGSAEILPLVSLSKSPSAMLTRSFVFFLAYMAAIEIASATHYVVAAFDPPTQVGVFDGRIELQLSFAPYAAVPWLCLGFLFSWAWVPLVVFALKRAGLIRNATEPPPPNRIAIATEQGASRRFPDWLDPRLLVALAVGAFVGFYPYFHDPGWLVGTDALWRYYDPLLRINAAGFGQALKERYPALLISLYAIQKLLNTGPYIVIEFVPLFLVLAMGLLTWRFLAPKDKTFGLVAFLLSTFSFTTAIGMFSSILASWTALVVWIGFAAFVSSRSERGLGVRGLIVALMLSTMFLFIHPWTWGLFAATIFFAGVIYVVKGHRRLGFLLVSIIALDAVVAFVSVILLPGSQGWRELEALKLYASALGNPQRLLVFWNALIWLTRALGLFFSPISITVSIVGVFCLMGQNTTPWRRRFILGWLLVSAIASILAAPVGFNPAHPESSETQLWRVLFLTPLQLTMPFGIGWLTRTRDSGTGQLTISGGGAFARQFWMPLVFAGGVASAWSPPLLRPLILFLLLPVLTMIVLAKSQGGERELLGKILLVAFLVLNFDYATRALSQLLSDPHNYRPH